MVPAKQIPQRVPYPMPPEIDALDNTAKTVLSMMSTKLPQAEFQTFARLVVDVSQNVRISRSQLRYASPDRLLNRANYPFIGEYNPDRIPIRTYEKMALHPQIALATSLIEQQILAQNYRLICDDVTQREFVNYNLKPLYRKTNKSKLKAIRFGFACGEKNWRREHVKIRIKDEDGRSRTVFNQPAVVLDRIKFAHPASITLIYDRKTENIKYVRQEFYTYDIDMAVPWRRRNIPMHKIVWFAPDSEYGNAFGNARYKNVYQPWYWHNIVSQFMLKYLERKGSPSTVMKAPPGKTKRDDGSTVDNLTVAMEAGVALNSNSVISLPRTFNKDGKEMWGVEQIEDSGRGDLFLDVLKYLNSQITRGLFVPDLVATSEGSGGSNATSQSRLDVHMISVEALIQEIEDCYNQQIIPQIQRFNFDESKIVPCTIKIDRLNFSKKTLLRDIFVRMIILSSGAMKDGVKPNFLPSIKQLADQLEIPVSSFDDMFLSMIENDDKDSMPNDISDEDEDDDIDGTPSDGKVISPNERDQNRSDQNKDAPQRRERTTRERNERKRL